jgi:RNA polymerase sigma-70 factor (ECF subfamily)
MSPESIEAAFARFCERCDPAAMAEVFDRTAPELRPLARRLTRGRIEADDLIQETFLAAIENRASFDVSRPLMPWLVGILVRQASAARRRARREVDPARFELKLQSAPDEDAEAGEFQRIVLDALSRLSSHDRAVLMPLLFDNKRAVQIARELGSRPDTIRMRIHRGLDRLRRLLPAGVVMPGLLGVGSSWSRVRATVLSSAARAGGAPLALPVASATSGVSLSMAVAFAIFVTLVLVWRFAPFGSKHDSNEGPASVAAVDPNANRAGRELKRLDAKPQREAVVPAADAPAAVVEPAKRVLLSGSVRGLEAREFASTNIEISGVGPEPIALRESAVLREDATFEVDVTRLAKLGARRMLVRVDHADHLPVERRIEFEGEPNLSAGTIALREAHTLHGIVVGHDGRPLAAATVGLFSVQRGSQDVLPVDVAATDAEGRFQLRGELGGPHALIAYREDLRPASRTLDLAGRSIDPGELRLEPGLTIAGSVAAEEDVDLAGVRVRCEASKTPGERRLRLGDRRFVRVGESFEYATILAACDARGHFSVNGLGAQVCDLSVQDLGPLEGSGPSLPQATTAVGLAGLRAPRFDVKLELPWSELEFQDREPRSDAARELVPRDELAIDVETLDAKAGSASVRLRLDPDSRARLQVTPGARYKVALIGCTREGRASFILEALPGGHLLRVPLDLASVHSRAALRLSFSGVGLNEGERLGVGFFPRGSASTTPASAGDEAGPALFERNALIDAERRALFTDLPPGAWRARVRIGGTYSRPFGFLLADDLDVELVPQATLDRDVHTERGGRARLVVHTSTGAPMMTGARLFDAGGREHPLDCVALAPDSAQELSGRIIFDTPNELGPLAAGDWRLELNALWHEPLSLPFSVELDRVTQLDAQLKAR